MSFAQMLDFIESLSDDQVPVVGIILVFITEERGDTFDLDYIKKNKQSTNPL